MSRQPERRHKRLDNELRKERDALKRHWDRQHRGPSETRRQTADVLEIRMAKSRRRQTDNLVTMVNQLVSVTDSDIARRAYGLYEERGSAPGHDMDDWLRAERELRPALSSTAA